jgi:hypothetical protein
MTIGQKCSGHGGVKNFPVILWKKGHVTTSEMRLLTSASIFNSLKKYDKQLNRAAGTEYAKFRVNGRDAIESVIYRLHGGYAERKSLERVERKGLLLTIKVEFTMYNVEQVCVICKKENRGGGVWTYHDIPSTMEKEDGLCPGCCQELFPQFYKDDKRPAASLFNFGRRLFSAFNPFRSQVN